MSSLEQQFYSAVDIHMQGRLQQAEKLYKKILKTHADHPDVLHLLGVVNHQLGKHQRAVDYIEKAIRLNPDVPDYYNNCGEACRALNKLDLAINYYKKAIALAPENPEANNNLGNALKDNGQPAEAIRHYERAIALKPDYIEAWYNLGNILHQQGKLQESVSHYEKALTLKPDLAEAHNNLGNVLKDQGLLEAAENHFRGALASRSDYANAHSNLAAVLAGQDRLPEAVFHYRQALALEPDNAEMHNNLGDVLQALQQLDVAINHYYKALTLKPDLAKAHNNLGTALAELGQYEDAINHYNKALALKPDYAEALNNMGNACQDLGQAEQAVEYFEKALALKPGYSEVYRHLAIFGGLIQTDEIISRIEKLLANPEITDKDAMHLHFALGDLFNDQQLYDQAFIHYTRANELQHQLLNYDPVQHSTYINRLIETYSRTFFAEKAGLGDDSVRPVFIIGMPRSGTTLVEQIIASHPQVFGAGELNDFLHFEQMLAAQLGATEGYPECMRMLDKPLADELIGKYLTHLQAYSTDARYVSDKLPGNFLRVGLIKTLFPGARIIHCHRNALDTCLSLYCNYFTGVHDYAYHLEDLGAYHLDYERLMLHWQAVFPGQILTVEYESLVYTQEVVSKQIIDYLGLRWDAKCLEFYKNKRPVQTASNLQVRQPVYTQAINRWKNYESHLGVLKEILETGKMRG